MNYFSISANIFDYALTPSELMVFCALSSIRNCLNATTSRVCSLSKRTGLSERTIHRAIKGLAAKQLLSIRRRNRSGGYITTNGYILVQLPGGKFKVDRSIWKHKLDASAFAVYLYLVKTANNTTRKAYPCLRKISAALNLCKNTVIAKVRLLEDRMLLVKERRISKRTNRFISNKHTLLSIAHGFICPVKRSRAKKKERTAMRSFTILHSTRAIPLKLCGRTPSFFSLACFKGLFKRVLQKFTVRTQSFLKLDVHFWQSRYYTHSGYSKRKILKRFIQSDIKIYSRIFHIHSNQSNKPTSRPPPFFFC